VTNGDTFPLAEKLFDDGVPFAFISASSEKNVPAPLQSAPFIQKPARREEVKQVLQAARLPIRPDKG
jgi:hypothetical protein